MGSLKHFPNWSNSKLLLSFKYYFNKNVKEKLKLR